MDAREKIIQAAYAEFAKKGYEHASTNEIVKNAGVAKGTLFYYFDNKKALYVALVDEGITFLEETYIKRICEGEMDILDRYLHISKIKLEAFALQPDISYFFATAVIKDYDNEEISEEIAKMYALNELAHNEFYEHMDTSKLRDDISVEESLQMIRWMMDGYEQELMGNLKVNGMDSDITPLFDEFDRYIDNLKVLFYKEEL